MIKSPIKNKVNVVFIPVNDVVKAQEWYSEVLGLDEGEFHQGHLFVAKTEGTGVILDSMPAWRNEEGHLPRLNAPVIQFGTDDIHASYQFMKEKGIELVTDVQFDQFFVFKDLDGNLLMVCRDD
ncbi:VOC family protein [Piscibacillus halophilus]|uniref:Glyoxalase/Bleomycin resistance protein/Dioxygenase superfamily protein n=1 Tax=Piscibacillus halophilus TaxID=571933 RepID=A0A1H9F3Q7_9BACI|nr:VOC family protein [Piscibacillus halophilus]SEQ32596.1 Glyoxalase/Bleomycin resistance protein/Dioxygenase superfamily protein [Piscibacillus halophilus]